MLHKSGIYLGVPDQVYFDDPCERPSLSTSIAKLLLNNSPRHAWEAHPRLNPGFERKTTTRLTLGQVAHCYSLEQRMDRFRIVFADSWRTKAAKEERDDAYAAGELPVLNATWDKIKEMELQRRAFCAQTFDHDPFSRTRGNPEVTLVWQTDDVWCRARIDFLPQDPEAPIYDFKTTVNANPLDLPRTAFGLSYDLQAAFYAWGLAKLSDRPPPIRMVFIFQEIEPPYACSACEVSEDALVAAEARIQRAVTTWKYCLEADDWPAYPPKIAQLYKPPWVESKHQDQELFAAQNTEGETVDV